MKKIVIHKPGGYQRLILEDFASSPCLAHEVKVTTKAIGVNYADVCVRWGVYQSAKEFVGWPITPGFEFAGIVTEVGPGVSRCKQGDEVFGLTFFNGYSEEIIVPEHQIFFKPKNWSFAQAAGAPAVLITAYHALLQNFILKKEMKILIHSAAGGVGCSLLQICKIKGCESIAVVGSSHKIDTAKKFGATHVIDKSEQNLWNEVEKLAPRGVDVILDANGPETLKQGLKHLAPCGKLISYGYHTLLPKMGGKINYLKALIGLVKMPRINIMDLCDQNKSVMAFNLSFLFDRHDLLDEAMADILVWMKNEQLQVPIVTTYPFDKVADAHRDLESGNTVGKLVLIPYSNSRC